MTTGILRAVLGLQCLFFMLAVSLTAQDRSIETNSRKLAARVPFVGCASDGQAGPAEPPTGENPLVPISAEKAQRLAFYTSGAGFGVLAPRDWYCLGVYGSGGAALDVSPEPIDAAKMFSTEWKGYAGPVVVVNIRSGGTPGRFEVAQVIARVFPAHRAFVRGVIDADLAPAGSFTFGPYPKDRLNYRGREIVEYRTPAQTEGLGTRSMLLKNPIAISGVAMLIGSTPDLLLLSVRLPPGLTNLTSTIIQQVERDFSRSVH